MQVEKEFIKFVSFSLKERINYIVNILKKKNVNYKQTSKYIYIPSKSGKYLLDSHIDIVGPLKKAEYKNEIFFGSGTSDNLGNSFILIYLLSQSKINLKKYSLVFPFDEEEEGKAPYLLNPKEKNVIVFEPTNLEVWNKSLGAYEFEILLKGESTHGAYAPKKDVIKTALAILNKFQKFAQLLKKYDKYTRLNLLSFLAGHKNIYNHPSKGYLRFEIITSWKIKKERFFKLMEKYNLGSYKTYLKEYDEGFTTSLYNFPTSFKVFKRDVCPSWTNAHAYYNLGKEAIVFGIGKLRYAHTENEKLTLKELCNGIKVFEGLFGK